MLKGEHSAILWTFFKLPVVVKTFVFVYFWVAVLHRFYCIQGCYSLRKKIQDKGFQGEEFFFFFEYFLKMFKSIFKNVGDLHILFVFILHVLKK